MDTIKLTEYLMPSSDNPYYHLKMYSYYLNRKLIKCKY